MVPQILTTVGLTLDIVGILLLLKFGIDGNRDIRPGATPLLWTAGEDEIEAKHNTKKFNRYVALTRAAYIAIVIGFALQIVAVWLK